MYSRLFKIFAILAVISMLVSPASAQAPLPTDQAADGKYRAESPDQVISSDTPARYIVLFEGDSLVAHQSASKDQDLKSGPSQNYLATLATKRTEILSSAQKLLGRDLKVRFTYDVVLNGVSVDLTPDEAADLAALPGVRKVLPVTLEQPDTDAGPTWIGADGFWDGTATNGGAFSTKGEGILAGILDTGINFDHPSFSDTPEDAFVYDQWTGDYLGVCNPTTGLPEYATACNQKLVGAYSYTTETLSPEDADGHGTHTASTVAGNYVTLEYNGIPTTISGVAPHAMVISYDVCDEGGCYGDASAAAVQQAILDGVDVINYSISGGKTPYSDPVELAFLEAFDAGIFVAASGGNKRTEPTNDGNVNHLSPWVMTVAASSHNRKFTNDIDVVQPVGSPYTDMALIPGSGPVAFPALTNVELLWGGDHVLPPSSDNRLGCVAYPAGFFTGKVALIQRGTCTFAVKVDNAAAAGALGVLMYADNRPPLSMGGLEATTIPAGFLYLSSPEAAAFATYVDTNAPVLINMSAAARLINDVWGDIKADFSFRGPGANNFEVIKPDITAPGLEILAGYADGAIDTDGAADVALLQGTSMSSPHTAGAGALIKAWHPDWSAAQVKSALMLTAGTANLLKEDMQTPADNFDFGAGRVDLEMAGLTGLVMDETYANFTAADPSLGGNPSTLNIASLQSNSCVGQCSWTRTFTSVSDMPATYTVTAPAWVTVDPATFSIGPGDTRQITITADVSAFDPDAWQYATIEFNTEDSHAGGDPVGYGSEGFESTTFPPTIWSVYDADGSGSSWNRSTSQFHSGVASAYHAYSAAGNQDGWLVSPPIPAVSGMVAKFWERTSYPDFYTYHGAWISNGSCDPVDGAFVEVTEYSAASTTWAQHAIGLNAYAGQDVCIAFRYQGFDADNWYIDDFTLEIVPSGDPISDVHMPLAVMPALSNLPAMVRFDTNRDAGGDSILDLKAVEISALTVDTYGFVKGNLVQIDLAQDPTNGSAYDDLSQVYYTIIPMDAGAARVVAEITATTAADLDMFWGFDYNGDGLPQQSEQYEASATSTALEYVSDYGFPAGFPDVWVLVQNWQGSGAATDPVTLSLGVVPWAPIDPATMTVNGPATNPAGMPFDLDIFWHDIDTQPGDRLYGLMDVYADADYVTNIGITEVDVVRGFDDVVKTADVSDAKPGDVVTYTLEITNPTLDPVDYTLNDVLPAGVTYVPDSVTGGGVYDAGTNAITWAGTVDASYRDYVATTSAQDPVACTLAIMTDGDTTDAYLDWKTTSYGFSTNAGISGDNFGYPTFSTYAPFNFYGVDYTGMQFTADGYTGFAMTALSNVNQQIPNATAPNNLMAMFWDDFTVVYDAAANKGVTMVGDGTSFATIEYDDIQLNADPTKTLDMEVGYFLQPDDAPGAYEIIFAYDNITPGLFAAASGTIGVENAAGTTGTLVSYNDTALEIADGSAICFDWKLLPAPPKVITFQVTVDADAPALVTNEVEHTATLFGALPEKAAWEIAVHYPPVAVDDAYTTLEDTALTMDATLGVLANDTDPNSDPLTAVLVAGPAHGTLNLAADGSFVYTPAADFFGTDTFTYTANNIAATSNVATVTITVTPVNDAPVADDQTLTVAEDTVLTGTLTATDVDSTVLTFAQGTAPAHGTLTIDTATGAFTYTPDADFFGTDSFTFTVSDGELSGTGTVTITVTDVVDITRIFLPVISR